jgi:hypothetical protein
MRRHHGGRVSLSRGESEAQATLKRWVERVCYAHGQIKTLREVVKDGKLPPQARWEAGSVLANWDTQRPGPRTLATLGDEPRALVRAESFEPYGVSYELESATAPAVRLRVEENLVDGHFELKSLYAEVVR